MNALFKLNLRQYRLQTRIAFWAVTLLVLLLPLLLFVCSAVWAGYSYRPDAIRLMMFGAVASVGLAIILAAIIGANAYAPEQFDRSIDFVGMLPVSGARAVATKLLAAASCAVLPYLIILIALALGESFLLSPLNPWRFSDWYQLHLFHLAAYDWLPVVAGSSLAVFGIGWACSAYMKSAPLALAIALAIVLGSLAMMYERQIIAQASSGVSWKVIFFRFYLFAFIAAAIGTIGIVIGCIHQMRRYGATGVTPMLTLVRKDLRTYRLPVLGTLLIGVLLYATGPTLGVLLGDYSEENLEKRFAESLGMASMLALICSPLFAGAAGGMAFASDRRERYADFMAMLPLSRRRLILVKLLVAMALSALIYFLAAAIFITVHLWVQWTYSIRFGYLMYSDLSPWNWSGFIFAITAAITAAVFGMAWFASSILRSAGLAMGCAVAIVLFCYFWVVIMPDRGEPGAFETKAFFFIRSAVLVAIGGLIAGSAVQLRRPTP